MSPPRAGSGSTAKRFGSGVRAGRPGPGGQGIVIRTHQESDPPFPGEALHLIEGGAIRSLSQLTPRAVLDQTRVPFPLALRVSALLASMGRWSKPLVADVEDLARALGGDP